MVVVRDAEAGDVPGILEIYNDVLVSSAAIWRDEPESLEERQAWFATKRAEGWPVLVAVDDAGEVVGFTALGPFRSWPGYADTAEHSIHVRAGMRGGGIGRTLLGALVERARAMGKEVLVAGVDGGNGASIAFHERLGFRVVARMPAIGKKYGDPVDLVLLQRELDGSPDPAAAIAEELGLEPHPEGGWFRETHRSAPAAPGGRSTGTAIYFLVTSDSPSHLHRVDAEEVFHHYLGDPVTQLVVTPSGDSEVRRVGPALDGGERPQAVVTAGSWQGCLVERPGGWALLGCTVAPGFELAGFELAAPSVVEELVATQPGHAALLRRLAP